MSLFKTPGWVLPPKNATREPRPQAEPRLGGFLVQDPSTGTSKEFSWTRLAGPNQAPEPGKKTQLGRMVPGVRDVVAPAASSGYRFIQENPNAKDS
jgi:hypothetical protein